MTNKVFLSSCLKTAFIYLLQWKYAVSTLHLIFNDLKLADTHTHMLSPLNLCLLKWSLMRCEQRTTTLSLPPSLLYHYFILLPSQPWEATEPDRQSYKDAQQAAHRHARGEKVMLELMGENKVSFFLLRYSVPPSIIMWSHREGIAGPVRDTLKMLSQAATNFRLFQCLNVRGNVCVWLCAVWLCCLHVGEQVRLDALWPPQREACPLIISHCRTLVLLLKTSQPY